jgi:hypothetical protein
MRAEYSKNKLPREIYLTPEAEAEMQAWDMLKTGQKNPDDLVFAYGEKAEPYNIYMRLSELFRLMQDTIAMNEMKDAKRRKITLYSFRRFAETVIEDHSSANFADYMLGHKKSPYYNKKESERAELYDEKCAPALTFLDYAAVEKRAKEIVAEKDRQFENLQAQLRNIQDVLGIKT